MKEMKRFKTAVLLLVILVLLPCFPGLPSPCHASFTIDDERKLGKEFYEKLAHKGALVENRKVNRYLNELGTSLTERNTPSPFDFTFSVIRDSGINAFATPGGYVYVYSGLIEIAENESQLAGVLAHEIAHVKARHIAKIIEKSQKVNIATLAAILAGAFIGGGGEGSAAITGFSLATAASLNLKYSRDHEEEADYFGMDYLVSTGYDGRGMLDFLKIMRQYEYYSNSVPSYFLTHPGTSDRIRYLDGLLQTRYKKRGATSILTEFGRVKTLLTLEDDDVDSQRRYFEERLKERSDDIEGLYGIAMVEAKQGKTGEALDYFTRALNLAPNDPDILRDLGITYFNAGKADDARSSLQKAHAIDPDDMETVLYLGRSADVLNDHAAALGYYQTYRKENPGDDSIYYNLAMAYGKMNDKGESHYNFGIFFKKKQKPKSALFHFEAALACFPPDSERASEIKKELEGLGNKTQEKPPRVQ